VNPSARVVDARRLVLRTVPPVPVNDRILHRLNAMPRFIWVHDLADSHQMVAEARGVLCDERPTRCSSLGAPQSFERRERVLPLPGFGPLAARQEQRVRPG